MEDLNKIHKGLEDLGIEYTSTQVEMWVEYLKLLEKWNKVYNMTAIKDFDDMVVKHLLDSLSVAKFIKGSSCIDVGTGGGLPGIPLAILFPDIKFTLVDSIGKKITFLNHVKQKLKLDNISPTNCRVESIIDSDFDNIISRAFSSIDDFYKLCKNLVSDTNQMLAMKGSDIEIDNLENLPLKHQIFEIKVPFLDAKRNIIILNK